MTGNNIILHCQEGSSDKIYIWAIRKVGNIWEVVGKWGRRGKNVSEQRKGSYHRKDTAESEAHSLAMAKEKKGYVDIDSPGYDGPLTRTSPEVAKYLELDDDAPTLPEKPKPVKKSKPKVSEGMPKLKSGEVCVAPCLDNTGTEGFFDVGVDYIVTSTEKGAEGGSQMILVIDSNGLSKGCYRNRFGKYKVE